MLANSVRTRGVVFAFLFGPPRLIEREEASKVHGRVCDHLKHDDFVFRYSISGAPEKPQSRGFSISFERKEGRGSFTTTIDLRTVNTPIRLLLSYDWPPSFEHVTEAFDMTASAVFDSLEGTWTKVRAEARLRAQCNTRQGDGLAFIKETLLASDTRWLSDLEASPLSACTVKFELPATPPQPDNYLAGPKRELTIEVLREDPRQVYLELMSQWSQISAVAQAQGQAVDLRTIRQITSPPAEYLRETYDYLQERVNSFAATKGEL